MKRLILLVLGILALTSLEIHAAGLHKHDLDGADGTLSGTLSVTGVTTLTGIADGGYTSYDLKIGDTTTPDYGMMQLGNASLGRTSYKAGNIDLDGAVIFRNIAGPVTSQIEFIWTESTGASTRFALPKSGVGNGTYNARSMIIAGPAPADTAMVTVGYWQTQGKFHNLAMDTAGDGADLGVQNDMEVEGDIFADTFKVSTSGADITYNTDQLVLDGATANVGVGTAVPESLAEFDGPLGTAIETVTGNTTLDNTHSTLLVNASGNQVTTLPPVDSAYNSTDGIGRIYTLKKIDADSDTVTLDGDGTETIDGGETAVLTLQYESIQVQAGPSEWHIQ